MNGMDRRAFLTLLGGAAVWPLSARAQQPQRMRRLGVLAGLAEQDPEWRARMAAFRQRLGALGWHVDQNIQIEFRYAVGDPERIQSATNEIVSLAPDVILVMSNPLLALLAQETRTVPIVFVQVADPVGSGFVASMARPGGNITGFTNFEPSMGGKWIELLREASPATRRVLVLMHPETTIHKEFWRAIEDLAGPLHVEATAAGVHNAAEIERAFVEFTESGKSGG